MSRDISPDQVYTPTWSIIQHESNRSLPVTMENLENAWVAGYNYITSSVTNDHFHIRVLKLLSDHMTAISNDESLSNFSAPIIAPFDPVDTPLTPDSVAKQLICHTASWIDISSPDPIVSSVSRQVLNMEVAYAGFCGIQTLIVPGPRICNSSAQACDGIARYARAIQEALAIAPGIFIAISLPMYSENQTPHLRPIMGDLGACCRPEFGDATGQDSHELFGAWDAWNAIRTMCNYAARLSVALEIPRQLPIQALVDRWYSEPLRSLSFTPATFMRNKAGHPVLGKMHQALLTRYMRLRYAPFLLLCDVGPLPKISEPSAPTSPSANSFPALIGSPPLDPSPNNPSSVASITHRPATSSTSAPSLKDQTAHLLYLRHLQAHQPPMSTIDAYVQSYQDYLQSPLQPLTDNLESVTYEVFEKDPVKYERYERAITLALSDWKALGKPKSGRGQAEGRVVVAVAGSGRGPLVTRALRAAKNNGMEIEMYALEKNPNAYVLLQRHNATDPLWNNRVHVIKSDMRAWKGPRIYAKGVEDANEESFGKVDILISELLGSFGDNELSPECLDGVQHVLAEQGISIPRSYTAHISPISYPKAHQDILSKSCMSVGDMMMGGADDRPVNSPSNTPYVVMLHAIDYLSKYEGGKRAGEGVIKEVWEFSHPLPEMVLRNAESRRQGGVSGGGGGSMAGGDGANEHNSRYSRTTFSIQNRGLCHGLGGWFESILYDGRRMVEATREDEKGTESHRNATMQGELVELSTRPDTMEQKSKDMISWFPMFFPLKTPVYVPDGEQVDVSMWRMTDDRKVWYEWQLEVFANVGPAGAGRRVRVGGSEVGTTRRGGCLM